MRKNISGLIILLAGFSVSNSYSMDSNSLSPGKYNEQIVGCGFPEENETALKCSDPLRQDYYFHRFMFCWTDCPSRLTDETKKDEKARLLADIACYKVCSTWVGCQGPMQKTVEMEAPGLEARFKLEPNGDRLKTKYPCLFEENK